MLPTAPFRAFRIDARSADYSSGLVDLTLDDVSPGNVVIRVAYSSVNYKDALAASGRGKILRAPRLVGGIDVAGHVVASGDARFVEGDAVLVTGCGLSETRDGGYSDYARLDADDIVPLPSGLSIEEAMIIGTAGFTAGLALMRMIANGQTPEHGPIVVTGASGGVGTLALDIGTRAGFEMHAISGKPEQFDLLAELGAVSTISRHGLYFGQRPLEAATWGGAIDNVGGDLLAGLTRTVKPYGSIAVCGLAGSPELATTVMPLILRGVSLLGIASAGTPYRQRCAVWERLAGDWKPAHLARIVTRRVGLEGLPDVFATMLGGQSLGRTLVEIGGATR